MAGASSERGRGQRGVEARKKLPDTYIGVANHKFGHLVGSEISHHFGYLVRHRKERRYVIHTLEHTGEEEGTTVVVQKVDLLYQDKKHPEELRLGHISGVPYELRTSKRQKDAFERELAAIIRNPSALIDPEDLRSRLIAEHPFLAAH